MSDKDIEQCLLDDRQLPVDDEQVDLQRSVLRPEQFITLQEQMNIEFTTVKKQEASRKMLKKIKEVNENKKQREDIVTFRYATDYSYLRRSTPDEVWTAIRRREAWAQNPLSMIAVTAVQLVVCIIILISENNHVYIPTLILSGVFVIAISLSNPLTICNELTAMIQRVHHGYTANPVERVQFYFICTILSPVILPFLLVAYTVTYTLDMTTGPILDVSYESMTCIINHMAIVFTTLSVALRSETLLVSLQVFAGFTFLYSLDDWIVNSTTIDLMEPAKRNNDVRCRITVVRILVYIQTAVLIGIVVYFTVTNRCILWC